MTTTCVSAGREHHEPNGYWQPHERDECYPLQQVAVAEGSQGEAWEYASQHSAVGAVLARTTAGLTARTISPCMPGAASCATLTSASVNPYRGPIRPGIPLATVHRLAADPALPTLRQMLTQPTTLTGAEPAAAPRRGCLVGNTTAELMRNDADAQAFVAAFDSLRPGRCPGCGAMPVGYVIACISY